MACSIDNAVKSIDSLLNSKINEDNKNKLRDVKAKLLNAKQLKLASKSGFQGYVGGFDSKGKGTPQGDGKDKAMRKIADGFIGEVTKNEGSTSTSSREILGKHEWMDATEDFKEPITEQTMIGGYDNPKIVMLARNGTLKNTPLLQSTKDEISSAYYDSGSTFVVGDMPGVDTQFIEYLTEIGASYMIYHSGSAPRVKIEDTATYSTTSQAAENSTSTVKPVVPKELNKEQAKVYKGILDFFTESKDTKQVPYWSVNIKEFLTVALSNPDMIKFLSKKAADMGDVKLPSKSLLKTFTKKLLSMVGFKKDSDAEFLLASLLSIIETQEKGPSATNGSVSLQSPQVKPDSKPNKDIIDSVEELSNEQVNILLKEYKNCNKG